MGFQVVLDASDSTVSIIGTGSSQRAESSNIVSGLSSADAFVLVQEALARSRGATEVRISACLYRWPQAQPLMLRLA